MKAERLGRVVLCALVVALGLTVGSSPALAEHPAHPPKPGVPVDTPPASTPPDTAPGLLNAYGDFYKQDPGQAESPQAPPP
jgi:hypothetical protein